MTSTVLSRPARRDRAAPGVFLALAVLVTWVVWVPRALESTGVLGGRWATDLGSAHAYGPALAAVLTAAWLGRPALRELGARLTRWRVGGRWWAVVLVGPPALWLATAGISLAVGAQWSAVRPPAVEAGVAGLIPLFVVLAVTDGLGEELGWRGFALPRLLARTGPVAAALLVGIVWAVWHASLHWTDGATLQGTPVWLLLLQLPACSVLYTWVFVRTGGSVLPAIALHTALNVFSVGLPSAGADWRPALVATGLLVALAVPAGVSLSSRGLPG